MLCLSLACGDHPEPADTTDTSSGAATPKPATTKVGKVAIDPATVGSISGVVMASGTVPTPSLIKMVGDSFCIQSAPEDGGYLDDRLLVQDGKLENAFVWIKSGLEGYEISRGEGVVTLDQKDCLYAPRIAGVQLGQDVQVTTSDPVLHNIHTHPSRNRAQNTAQIPKGPPVDLIFKKPEVMVRVACDIHAWMSAWIGVVEHPYFAVTGADGSYSLEDVPPGTYTLGVWHETRGEQEVSVTVGDKADVTAGEVVYQL